MDDLYDKAVRLIKNAHLAGDDGRGELDFDALAKDFSSFVRDSVAAETERCAKIVDASAIARAAYAGEADRDNRLEDGRYECMVARVLSEIAAVIRSASAVSKITSKWLSKAFAAEPELDGLSPLAMRPPTTATRVPSLTSEWLAGVVRNAEAMGCDEPLACRPPSLRKRHGAEPAAWEKLFNSADALPKPPAGMLAVSLPHIEWTTPSPSTYKDDSVATLGAAKLTVVDDARGMYAIVELDDLYLEKGPLENREAAQDAAIELARRLM